MRRSICSLLLSATLLPAGEAPFGHADWKASPTDPVGFAGQGNNWYPGATPPTQWWEGTPTKTTVEGIYGNPPRQVEAEVEGYADQKSKNILWKVSVPGHGNSLPIVVGNRVISLTSPHFVTCYDADTGKVLWQDDLKVMTLPCLDKDRKTVTEAPPKAEAARLQELFEAGLSLYRVGCAISPGKKVPPTAENMTPREPLVRHVKTVLEGWKPSFGARSPEFAKALDDAILSMQELLDKKYAECVKGKSGKPWLPMHFVRLVEHVTVPIGNAWPGHISDTMATPVSDGEILGVTFGHGQVAAYEVATGKRLWALRDPGMRATSASHCPSPVLWKDVLIVPAGGQNSGDCNMTMLALDKRTGAIRWESSRGPGGCPAGQSHGDHMSPHLARLPDGKGGVRAVVIANMGAVLDPETGNQLLQLPIQAGDNKHKNDGWGSGFVCALNDRIYKGWGGDCEAPPVNVWPVEIAGPDKIVAGLGFTAEAGSSHGPFALADKGLFIGRGIFDPATGKRMAEGDLEGVKTIAGNRLIIARDARGTADWHRSRKDRMCLKSFSVFDISDPQQPKRLSDGNLLGGPEMPSDIADVYFPEFKHPDLKQFALGCYHGLTSGFGVQTSGVTAHGSRLYIKSNTHLYCIGEK